MINLSQRIRNFEKRLQANMEKVFCPTHLSLGQEWVAVELASVMRSDDWLFSTHRNHHHYLAKGGSESRLWDEIMGLPTGLNGGFAGSQSITDPSINFHSSAIVGGLIGVAAGTSLALKLNNSSAVTICCLGDAGTEQGVFWETLNFAALQALPLVFVIENNGKSVDAHISERQATPLTPRIPAFGVEVCDSVVSAVERCREYRRPTLFEAKVTLECAHLNMATMLDLCTVTTEIDGGFK